MTGITIKNQKLMALAALLAACCLLMSCVRPAYANVDPTWEEETAAVEERTAAETPEEETVADAETEPEQGFSTPGNGDLGDEIKGSSGKDFYTIRTKNNNIFYMVIDHSNSTENVYMLSLVDENDLAEFMNQTETESMAEAEAAPAVIIPETTAAPAETETSAQEETEEAVPEKKAPLENSSLLIVGAGAIIAALLYYFKIYKPGREEEADDNEGMEIDDGLKTERED